MVRDVLDRKGNPHPDVGSIVAYALSSTDYEAKRQKLREISSRGDSENLTKYYITFFLNNTSCIILLLILGTIFFLTYRQFDFF